MSILSELAPAAGKKGKRLGRGKGSGKGGTSGKGHKGQKSRSGAGLLRGFEGGQMPLARRLPKFGFTNKKFKTSYDIVNLDRLNLCTGDTVGVKDMVEKNWVAKKAKIKVLGKGKLTQALTVTAHCFSKSAAAAIEKAGGKAVIFESKPESKPENKKEGKL